MAKGKLEQLNFVGGIKDGLPIGLGYLSVSIAFGVQASIQGLPILLTLLISMTNLTSAGQLAGLGIVVTLGSFIEIILTQLVINSRYFLMSISLSQKVDARFPISHRLLTSAFITDEIYGVASAKKGTLNAKYLYGLALLPYFGWALGTLIGAVAGSVLPTSITNALGIGLYAMFIAIIVPPSMKNLGVLFTVILSAGISCALFFTAFFTGISDGFATIISAVTASLVMAWIFPVKKEEEGADKELTETENSTEWQGFVVDENLSLETIEDTAEKDEVITQPTAGKEGENE